MRNPERKFHLALHLNYSSIAAIQQWFEREGLPKIREKQIMEWLKAEKAS